MKKRGWKIALGAVLFLAALAAVAWLVLLRTVTAPWVQEKLQQVVAARTDSLYAIRVDSVFVDIPEGIFQLHRVTLEPVRPPDEGKPELRIAFDALEVNRIRWVRYFLQRDLYLNSIRLRHPVISLADSRSNRPAPGSNPVEADSAAADSARGIRELLRLIPPAVQKVAKSLRVDTLSVEGADLEVRGSGLLKASGLNAAFSDLHVSGRPEQPVTATDFVVGLESLDLKPPGRLYQLAAHKASASVRDSSFRLASLEWRTRVPDSVFFKRRKVQDLRIKSSLSGFSITGWDYLALLFDRKVKVRRVELGSGLIDLATDARYPSPTAGKPPRYTPFPHEQLAALPLDLTVDSLLINGLDFHFREFQNGSRPGAPPSRLSLQGTRLALTGLRRRPGEEPLADTLRIKVRSRLMNSGDLRLDLVYPVAGKAWNGRIKGAVTGLQAESLNPLTGPLARLEFDKKARIHRLAFQADIRNNHAKGGIEAEYEHLRIRMLRKNSDEARVLMSALGNLVLIDNNLGGGKKEMRKGGIDVKRDSTKGFPAHLVKLLQGGLMEILLPPKVNELIKKQQDKAAAASKPAPKEARAPATPASKTSQAVKSGARKPAAPKKTEKPAVPPKKKDKPAAATGKKPAGQP